jgi:hypothetical protein
MHLAYSALHNATNAAQTIQPVTRKLKLRYKGYKAACQKYEQEIAAIRQYLPGWQPAFK